jgi:large subunit ribosomal protein L34
MPKRTYQPKKKRRARKLGFHARKATKGGQRVLERRKKKGRAKLVATELTKGEKRKRYPNKRS